MCSRPREAYCKRGHPRIVDQSCIPCRRYRERLKYNTDPVFRAAKIAKGAAKGRAFKEKHGYWPSKLYNTGKPKRQYTRFVKPES